jgi:uncharacterized protein
MTTGAFTAYFARNTELEAMLHSKELAVNVEPYIPAATAAIIGLYISLNFNGLQKKIVNFFSPHETISSAASKVSDAVKGKKNSAGIHKMKMHAAAFGSSLLFGLGLGLSGMCSPERVQRFLDFTGAAGWDPSLAGVMGGGVVVTFLSFHAFKHFEAPVLLHDDLQCGSCLHLGLVPNNLKLDWKLVAGAALFGMGWGLAGMCPGPALVSVGGAIAPAIKFVPSMIAGMLLQELLLG